MSESKPVYVYLRKGAVVHRSRPVDDDIILDSDKEGNILGVEILRAKKVQVAGKDVLDIKLGIVKRLTEALNKHSKPMAEGGLDYVKAFEEVEDLEKELYREARGL